MSSTPKSKKKPKIVLKNVTNEDFELAYFGRPGDDMSRKVAADNRNIIKAVLRKFKSSLCKDELEACGMRALWRTLQYHSSEYGQKFTTSLHRFTNWECLREIRRHKRNNEVPLNSDPEYIEKKDNLEIADTIEEIDDEHLRDVFIKYYLDDASTKEVGELTGISKETARCRIIEATNEFHKLYGGSR